MDIEKSFFNFVYVGLICYRSQKAVEPPEEKRRVGVVGGMARSLVAKTLRGNWGSGD